MEIESVQSFNMSQEQNISNSGPEDEKKPSVNTGNASNPSPQDDSLNPADGAQLLDEKAEKYLREVASIEDVPDAQDQEEMDRTIKKNNEKG